MNKNYIKNKLKDINYMRNDFNKEVLEATYKAQKQYGFKMGTGEHATWNNEADAFKHAYMQWHLAWYYNNKFAKYWGDRHENETPNAPSGERNMDLWNNAIGREVAYEMQQELGNDWDLLGEEHLSEIASRKIVEKMRRGELITSPEDPRKFENMELERLSENDRVYSADEYSSFDEKYKATVMDSFLDDVIGNNWQTPTKEKLDARVKSGELIYVEDYTRANGSKVHGYYRRKPIR